MNFFLKCTLRINLLTSSGYLSIHTEVLMHFGELLKAIALNDLIVEFECAKTQVLI